MCLERGLKNNPLKIADTDIVCYKGVQVPYEKWFKFKTWWMRKLKRITEYNTYFTSDLVTIGETFIALPIFTKDDLQNIEKYSKHLTQGFIHSFKNKSDALKFAKREIYIDVVECIIPAGTYYFEGTNSDDTDGYVSTQVKYIKVIR